VSKGEWYPIPFGKYKGRDMFEVAREDPSYMKWLVGVLESTYDSEYSAIAEEAIREVEEEDEPADRQ